MLGKLWGILRNALKSYKLIPMGCVAISGSRFECRIWFHLMSIIGQTSDTLQTNYRHSIIYKTFQVILCYNDTTT